MAPSFPIRWGRGLTLQDLPVLSSVPLTLGDSDAPRVLAFPLFLHQVDASLLPSKVCTAEHRDQESASTLGSLAVSTETLLGFGEIVESL